MELLGEAVNYIVATSLVLDCESFKPPDVTILTPRLQQLGDQRLQDVSSYERRLGGIGQKSLIPVQSRKVPG